MAQGGESNVVFNKIYVNSVDSGSGIFIGNNAAHGWTTVRKDNSGFGRAGGSTIGHSCFVVYDNDHIDNPVEARDTYLLNHLAPVSQNISFQSIDVNAITTNSTIAVGENRQAGWMSTGKSNMGDGRHKGINVLQNNVNTVVDEDGIDAPVISLSGVVDGSV